MCVCILHLLKASGDGEKKINLICPKALVCSESRLLLKNCLPLHLFFACGREQTKSAMSAELRCSCAVQKTLR